MRRRAHLDDLHVRVVQQPLRALHRHLRDHVHLAALQRQDLRLLVGEEDELGAGRQRLGAPVVGVADEARAHLRRILLQLERPGADEGLLPVPGVVGGQDDCVVVVGRHDVREVAVRRIEVELHREVIDLARAADRQHAAERRQRVRPVLRVGKTVHRRHHVVGAEHAPVVELHVGAQREGPDRAVLVGFPGQRQHRAQHQVRLVEGQELAGLHEQDQAARVRHADRLHRARRGRGSDADRGVLLASLRPGRGRHRRDWRCRAARRSAAAPGRTGCLPAAGHDGRGARPGTRQPHGFRGRSRRGAGGPRSAPWTSACGA